MAEVNRLQVSRLRRKNRGGGGEKVVGYLFRHGYRREPHGRNARNSPASLTRRIKKDKTKKKAKKPREKIETR